MAGYAGVCIEVCWMRWWYGRDLVNILNSTTKTLIEVLRNFKLIFWLITFFWENLEVQIFKW